MAVVHIVLPHFETVFNIMENKIYKTTKTFANIDHLKKQGINYWAAMIA